MANDNSIHRLTWTNIIAMLGLGLSLMGMFWVLMNAQIANIDKRLDISREDIGLIRNATEVRVLKPEFVQFENGMRDRLRLIENQLRILESTRPTTGIAE